MSNRWITLLSVSIALVSLSLWAQEKSGGHSQGMSHSSIDLDSSPQEGGQAMFAALIEIVSLLESDDDTNWDSVDINALRSHLLDMHQLIVDTNATTSLLDNHTIRFDIAGTAESTASIHRMVVAHSRFIEQSRHWDIDHELKAGSATLTIRVNDREDLTRLNALGFYGFMSLDSHHQNHHFQIATGKSH